MITIHDKIFPLYISKYGIQSIFFLMIINEAYFCIKMNINILITK